MAKNTINTPIASSPVYTSTLVVQGYQRLNVSIRIGSVDVSTASIVLSTFSGLIRLQRQLFGDDTGTWRDVQSWSIVSGSALDGASENIVGPVPETATYRLGCDNGDYYGVGAANVRLGAS